MSSEKTLTEVYIGTYIGLGSNLSNPAEQIKTAVAALKALPDTNYLADSGLFLSKPMLLEENEDAAEQGDYYNAVALLETRLPALELLDQLQRIENAQGRKRDYRWAPRTLDLDILMYGQQQIQQPRLHVPHPGIADREFVLYPLQRLCEKMQYHELTIPDYGQLAELLKSCPENDLEFIGEIE